MTATKKTAIANAAAAYARNAASDPRAAIEGGIAAKSGVARVLMIATAAVAGMNANGANAIDAGNVNTGTVKAGFEALGYKASEDDADVKANEYARARAWVYAINDPDNAEVLGGHTQAGWDVIGKALANLEKERDARIAENADDPKADEVEPTVTLADGIKRAKAMLEVALKDIEAKGADARASLDVHRAMKSLKAGSEARRKAVDPARKAAPVEPVEPVEPLESEKPKSGIYIAPEPKDGDTGNGDTGNGNGNGDTGNGDTGNGNGDTGNGNGDTGNGNGDTGNTNKGAGTDTHYTAQRDAMATLMMDIIAALDSDAAYAGGKVSLPVSAGARGASFAKRINAARKVLNKAK